MSILKTDPKLLAPWAHVTASQHDALAAHAMQMALKEAKEVFGHALYTETIGLIDWINERAAANLARIMGEGNA